MLKIKAVVLNILWLCLVGNNTLNQSCKDEARKIVSENTDIFVDGEFSPNVLSQDFIRTAVQRIEDNKFLKYGWVGNHPEPSVFGAKPDGTKIRSIFSCFGDGEYVGGVHIKTGADIERSLANFRVPPPADIVEATDPLPLSKNMAVILYRKTTIAFGGGRDGALLIKRYKGRWVTIGRKYYSVS